jgi:hypothetical protein
MEPAGRLNAGEDCSHAVILTPETCPVKFREFSAQRYVMGKGDP